MSTPTLTRDLAWSAAQDAANAQMRTEGRSKWSPEDYQLAVREFDRLWPEERDYTADGDGFETRLSDLFPGQPCWTCPRCGRRTIGGYCNGCGHRYPLPCVDLSNLGQARGRAEMRRIFERHPDLWASFTFARGGTGTGVDYHVEAVPVDPAFDGATRIERTHSTDGTETTRVVCREMPK